MIRGTNHDQDARFADKTKKMLEKSTWPDKYDIKIDLKKVDYELIKVWIEKKITKILGQEDDIVSGTIISHLDQSLEKEEKVNAKTFHVAVSGVLQEKTLLFVSDLWDILDEAQRSPRGIPECLVQEKKQSEKTHRSKLDELQQKRHKMNVSRFERQMKGVQSSRARYGSRGQEQRYDRDYDYEHKHKKRQKEDRSKSRQRQKKYRSRTPQRRKRDKSRDKHSKREKQRRRQRDRSVSPPAKQKKINAKKQRRDSSESDSSGVVSSSNSSE